MSDTDRPEPAYSEPADPEIRDLTDLPLQPTGSGVADMEIALMQAAVADEVDGNRTDDDAPTRPQA